MIDLLQEGGLWRLTLNRPDRANALTKPMLEALIAHIEAAEAGGAQALVLTGQGKVFSAGADLDAARAGLATDPVWEVLSARLAAAPFLTIAALNGTLAGGAFGMALACDLRIAVPDATLFYPVMKLGFLPQPSDPGRMAALIGPARARMILMAGVRINATQAQDWGLIDQIAPAEGLLDAAAALAKDACAAPPGHPARIKAMIPREWSQR